MFSLQEIQTRYEKQLRNIREVMDRDAVYHPEVASIYQGLSYAEATDLYQSLKRANLKQIIEFLGKGQTLGDYMVAAKVHDDLVSWSAETDIVPLISSQIVNGWEGGDLQVTVANHDTYIANEVASGATSPSSTVESVRATLSPIHFNINASIAQDLEEDAGFAVTDWHVRNAAKACGLKASSLALYVLWNAPDGWGTVNTAATGDAGETKWTGGANSDVIEAMVDNAVDGWKSRTIVTSPTSWFHSLYSTIPAGTAQLAPNPGFDHNIAGTDVLLWVPESDITNGAAKLLTIVFDKNNAMLTGRKRWMQLSNYADPVGDLAGAVINCRQDSVTLNKDAIYVLSET